MIYQNNQNSLFTTKKTEAYIVANTTEAITSQWFKLGYLSFDIANITELQDPQLNELTFVSKLFSSSLSLDTINELILKLEKPYTYQYPNIYYDVFENEWKYLPEPINEQNITEEYINSLDGNDTDEINSLIDMLSEKLGEHS